MLENFLAATYTTSEAQLDAALASKAHYQQCLTQSGIDKEITTEIKPIDVFYYAEDYHQQYLAKNPQGYCGLGGLGVGFDG
jgi:peptide-methionine (S)-S-oxide reductase